MVHNVGEKKRAFLFSVKPAAKAAMRELLLDDGDLAAGGAAAHALPSASAPAGEETAVPRSFPSASARADIPERRAAMSVDEFRRLVQELYLENPENAASAASGAAVRNVAVLVDTSGSMERQDPRLHGLKASLSALAAQLAELGARGGRLNFCLIGFSEKVTLSFSVEGLDSFTADETDPLCAAIHRLRARGGTNYEAAFRAADAWFAGLAEAGENIVYFVTDGRPTCYYHDSFTHCIPADKAGVYQCNGTEFKYSGKGRSYYDAAGRAVGSNSGTRRYRVGTDGGFEVRVGSSLNWSTTNAAFIPNRPARRVSCALPERYAPGAPLYYDAAGNPLPGVSGAAYRISAGGSFEQLRRGAWHEPEGMVLASAFITDGAAPHTDLSNKVLGGDGARSGDVESGKSLYACRMLERGTGKFSLFALGIGGAVDVGLLNMFDSAAQAQVLADAGQLAAALTTLSEEHLGAAAFDLLPDVSDMPQAEAHDGFGVHADASHAADLHAHEAMPDSAHGFFLDGDPGLLTDLGSGLLEDGPRFDDALAAPASTGVDIVRHFNLGADHLNVRDLLGEHESMDALLSRITAGMEVRTVDGAQVSDLVLQIHADAQAHAPVVHTIVLEDFSHLNPEAPDDIHFLLQQLLYG